MLFYSNRVKVPEKILKKIDFIDRLIGTMQENYPFEEIEPKWQAYWKSGKFFHADLSKADRKYYCLVMFPYPSAALHVGHGRTYIIGDSVARYKKMQGFNVLTPMGWDAFGLPAENAAIKTGTHPKVTTLKHIAVMKKQFNSWGVCYDWDREVTTCLPDYYKWTQWLFLKLFERGLAYKDSASVNWCPSCSTVLANEQVIHGKCERCDSDVQEKNLEQWFFRITDYAQRLLDDLDKLDGWPERVKIMQKNWIGRSDGARIEFPLVPHRDGREDTSNAIPCFTTRVDTIFGCTYMVLAPEYPGLPAMVKGLNEEAAVMAFISQAKKLTSIDRMADEKEKNGVFTGRYVINPFNGQSIPLWVGDYVLMSYGTGAVMAVPAHDTRDWAFAKKYGLLIRLSIQNSERSLKLETMNDAYCDDGFTCDSKSFSNLTSAEARDKLTDYAAKKKFGDAMRHYRLRDWLISRQRYWGTPIPIIYCKDCGIVPVPEEDLPVVLPHQVDFKLTNESPLSGCPEFMNVKCPKCGKPARREKDTMDTFVDSSWYFLRYVSSTDDQHAINAEICNRWMPVDQYTGGIEHAILHLMYARFFTKVIYDMGFIAFDEPFAHLFTQGMICKRSEHDGQMYKMSKSKGNVVSPDDLIREYGADTIRLYTLFISPPEKDAEWDDRGIEGAFRFLKRLWRHVYEHRDLLHPASSIKPDISAMNVEERNLLRKTHETIERVTSDMEGDFHFNTAIAQIMELMNAVDAFDIESRSGNQSQFVYRKSVETIVLMISPFAPHIAEELWVELGNEQGILKAQWPVADKAALERDQVEVAIQVNGKVRSTMTTAPGLDRKSMENSVLEHPAILKWIENKEVVKIIIVPDKLANIVVRNRAESVKK